MPAQSADVKSQQHFEIIDTPKLAERLSVPRTWISEQTRSRAIDPLPCLVFGRYKRFRWNSPELNAWIVRRMKGGKQ